MLFVSCVEFRGYILSPELPRIIIFYTHHAILFYQLDRVMQTHLDNILDYSMLGSWFYPIKKQLEL